MGKLKYRLNAIYKGKKQQILDNLPRAKAVTLRKIVGDVDPFVPYKTGKLSESVEINDTASSFTYTAEYASFAFDPDSPSGTPKNYNHSVHVKATGNPVEAAQQVHDEEWGEFFKEELLKGVK